MFLVSHHHHNVTGFQFYKWWHWLYSQLASMFHCFHFDKLLHQMLPSLHLLSIFRYIPLDTFLLKGTCLGNQRYYSELLVCNLLWNWNWQFNSSSHRITQCFKILNLYKHQSGLRGIRNPWNDHMLPNLKSDIPVLNGGTSIQLLLKFYFQILVSLIFSLAPGAKHNLSLLSKHLNLTW